MADVDAVEGADRHRARPRLELAGARATVTLPAPGERLGRQPAERLVHRQRHAPGRPRRPRTARPPCGAASRSARRARPRSPARTCPELTCRSRRGDAVAIGDDVERVYLRAPERHLDRHAAPVQAVRALAADLDRGGGRDRQLDLPAEARELRLELVRGRRLVPVELLPLRIAGRRPRAQVDVREVALVEPDEALTPASLRVRTTGRSSPVANGSSVPAWPVLAPVRRRTSATTANDERPGGLVDEEDPGRLEPRGGIALGGVRRPVRSRRRTPAGRTR